MTDAAQRWVSICQKWPMIEGSAFNSKSFPTKSQATTNDTHETDSPIEQPSPFWSKSSTWTINWFSSIQNSFWTFSYRMSSKRSHRIVSRHRLSWETSRFANAQIASQHCESSVDDGLNQGWSRALLSKNVLIIVSSLSFADTKKFLRLTQRECHSWDQNQTQPQSYFLQNFLNVIRFGWLVS